MSKTAEKNLWAWLSKARSYYRGNLHINRVENGVGEGFPDVEGHLRDHGTLLIELKTAARPKRKNGKVRVKVRPAQVSWHISRIRAGQKSWFLIQVGQGAAARRYLTLGVFADSIREGMTEEHLARISRLVETPSDAVLCAASCSCTS